MSSNSLINPLQRSIVRVKDSPRVLCATFLFVFALPSIIYSVNQYNLVQLKDQSRQNSNAVYQDIRERIGVIHTVLDSMAGLYDVSSDLDNDNLRTFSGNILTNAQYIGSLGRYEYVTHDKRASFETAMSHNGYSDFSIAQIDAQGLFERRTSQPHYYPVSIAVPYQIVDHGL